MRNSVVFLRCRFRSLLCLHVVIRYIYICLFFFLCRPDRPRGYGALAAEKPHGAVPGKPQHLRLGCGSRAPEGHQGAARGEGGGVFRPSHELGREERPPRDGHLAARKSGGGETTTTTTITMTATARTRTRTKLKCGGRSLTLPCKSGEYEPSLPPPPSHRPSKTFYVLSSYLSYPFHKRRGTNKPQRRRVERRRGRTTSTRTKTGRKKRVLVRHRGDTYLYLRRHLQLSSSGRQYCTQLASLSLPPLPSSVFLSFSLADTAPNFENLLLLQRNCVLNYHLTYGQTVLMAFKKLRNLKCRLGFWAFFLA